MDQVDARIIPLPILFVILLMIATVLVVVGTGVVLYVLTKKRRGESRQHAVRRHRSTTLWTLLAIVVAAPVFLVLFYFQHGVDRPAMGNPNSGLETPELATPDEEHVPVGVLTDTPAPQPKSICGRSPASDDLPAWVCQPQTRNGKRNLVVIVGQQFVTADEAEQNAMEQAEQRLRADFERSHPADIAWTIPLELVQSPVLLRNRFLRRIKRTSGSTTFHVQQMILQLELSPEGRKLIYPVWRDRIVGHRLWILGRVLLLLTGILVTATLYFRLDARSDGQFRLRLKLAAVVAVVAFGILIETASSTVEQMIAGVL